MIKAKKKGTNAERELVHKFNNHGWSAIRVAGSGSANYPSPDIIAGKNNIIFGIECKATISKNKYLTFQEVEELIFFCRNMGIIPMISIKFDKEEWYFIYAQDLKKTEKNFVLNLNEIKSSGITFKELLETERFK